MNELIAKLEVELKSRGFSRKTVKSYMFHVSRFLAFVRIDAADDEIKKYFDMPMENGTIPKDTNLRLLFLVRLRNKGQNVCRLYEYKFMDNDDINSIKFVQAVQYNVSVASK